MKLEEIIKTMKSIKYKGPKGFGWKVQHVWFGTDHGWDIRVYIKIQDRVGGNLEMLYTHYTYGPEEIQFMTPISIVRRVKAMLIYLETHEVEEQLLYKGRRVFDPHKEKLEGPFVNRELKKHNEKVVELKRKVIEQLKESDNAIPHAKEN